MKIDPNCSCAPLNVGDEFLKYEIRALLGHGDHAYVYEALDTMFDRIVAIKVILDLPNSRRDLVQRSLEQAPILRDLNHPNLVSIYDVGTIGDELVYIVMERLFGRSLRSILVERKTLSLPEILSIGVQVAAAMAWAHMQEVIHRDLKPENVIVTDKHGVKVINTGITSFIIPSGMTTEWDCVRGTLLYMSPEHIQGFGVTARSDIYALGTLLYECLAGSPPALVGAGAPSLDEVTWRQISVMPPPLDELSPTVPRSFSNLVQQMLAKEAVLRNGTMDEVEIRLREIQERWPGGTASEDQGGFPNKPYIVFPSSALGMNVTPPRKTAPSQSQVIAGAERLVNALAMAQPADPQSPPPSLSPHVHARRDRRRVGVVISLGILAGIVFAWLKSGQTPTGDRQSTSPTVASRQSPGPMAFTPSARPTRVSESLGEVKKTKESESYTDGSRGNLGSEPSGASPVIDPDETRTREPKAKPSASVPNELVF
jgi:serine/threonine protein kinase